MIKVFVYGTLKRGEGNHRLLQGRSAFVGQDSINGKLFDLGSFPAIIPGPDVVSGEIYWIGPHTLRDLDRLEGHPHFYERKPITTLLSKHDVWAYFMKELPTSAKYLPEGIWHPRLQGL